MRCTLSNIFLCTLIISLGSAGCSANQERQGEPLSEPIDPALLDVTRYDNIVIVLDQRRRCTGTLIEPDIVLTAKHCVADTKAEQIEIHTGIVPEKANFYARVERVRHTAGDMIEGEDIAVLKLDSSKALPTRAWNREGRLPIGELVLIVGYGQRPGAEGNAVVQDKRVVVGRTAEATPFSASLWPSEFVVVPLDGAVICFGDSGAPVMNLQGAVVGVVSQNTARCEGVTVANYIEPYAHFVSEALRAEP